VSNDNDGVENIIKTARDVQDGIMKLMEVADRHTVSVSSGGGAVTAVVNWKLELVSISMEPEVINPDESEMLSDLITAAVNEALSQAQRELQREFSRITSALTADDIFKDA
jgi:DNA-binding YbaB/EbfC family protein